MDYVIDTCEIWQQREVLRYIKKGGETEFIVINKRQEQKFDKAFKCIFFSKCDRRITEH